jgi:hypothetical protein
MAIKTVQPAMETEPFRALSATVPEVARNATEGEASPAGLARGVAVAIYAMEVARDRVLIAAAEEE